MKGRDFSASARPSVAPPRRVLDELGGEAQGEALAVDLRDRAAVVGVGRGDLDEELEPPRPQQRAVEGRHEVRRAHHEDHLVLAKAVHLREELVDHRVLHPRALVAPALVREGVDLVEDDHRGRALTGLAKDPPEVLFRLAHPLRLELRPRDHDHRRVHRRGDGLGEVGLSRARRAVKDHAAGEQRLERANVALDGEGVFAAHQIEELVAQPGLHLAVAADVAVEVDARGARRRR
ncbi:MAG: hypothetical protein R3A48_25250 [Polyangiales bacterium]